MFEEFCQLAKKLAAKNLEREEIITYLKSKGASQIQTVRAIKKAFNLSLNEADRSVLNSEAWKENLNSNIFMRNGFFAALEISPEKEDFLFNTILKDFPEDKALYSYEEFEIILSRVEDHKCGVYDIAVYSNKSLVKVITYESYAKTPNEKWYWAVLKTYSNNDSLSFCANFQVK